MENEFMKPYKKEVKQEEVMAQTEAEEQFMIDDSFKDLDMLSNDANALELAD